MRLKEGFQFIDKNGESWEILGVHTNDKGLVYRIVDLDWEQDRWEHEEDLKELMA